MTVLIGTAPDQVPTNGMLGTLAFKDEEGYLFSQTMPAIKPTLNLDFINSKQVDPRITFARGTTATYYDGKTTAVAEQNLVSNSQDISNAAWSKSYLTVTSDSTTAPDGTTTADAIFETAITTAHTVSQTISALTNCVISAYVKPNGRDWCLIASGSGYSGYWFNVTTGEVGAEAPGTGTTSNPFIISVGNGWYRVGYTTTSATNIQIFTATADNTSSFTGDITKGLYLWGAQVEKRSSATAYTPTTTTPITNYIPQLMTAPMNVPRLDYDPITGKPLGLLIEESKANVQPYSSTAGGALSTKQQISVVNSIIVAPDGSVTGNKLVEDTSTATHTIIFTNITPTANLAYTFSAFVKAGERSKFIWTLSASNYLANISATYDLSTGLVSSIGAGTTSATMTPVGNGWYRCTLTGTAAATPVNSVCNYMGLRDTGTNQTYTGDGYSGLYIWGCQHEQSSFATSYIPTATGSVTRNADAASMTGTNFSSWYNQSQGAVIVQADTLSSNPSPNSMIFEGYAASGFAIATIGVGTSSTTSTIEARAILSSYTSTLSTTWGKLNSLSVSYSNIINAVAAMNGASVALNTSSSNRNIAIGVGIGSRSGTSSFLNGHIKKIAYYPQALSTAELQGLTS